jgi:hypothetical protein
MKIEQHKMKNEKLMTIIFRYSLLIFHFHAID